MQPTFRRASTIAYWAAVLGSVSCRDAASAVVQQTAPPFTSTSGSFFALSVQNLSSASQWYVEKFGLAPKLQVPKTNGVAVAVLEGGGLIVELVQRDDAMPLSQAAPGIASVERIHGVTKVGFVVDNLNESLNSLRSRGVEVVLGPFPATSSQRANVIVKDGSGNVIQLFGK